MDDPTPDVGIYPVGHYYSPVPVRADAVFAAGTALHRLETPGVDLQGEAQLELAREYAQLDQDFADFVSTSGRFSLPNDWFSYGDAFALYAFMATRRPGHIVEVGSGYSSALMLDARDRLALSTDLTFIEPESARLKELVSPEDLGFVSFLEQRVQDVSLDPFLDLDPGDLLFIDSSHVVKTGSDVLHLYLEVLPRLAKGVFVHIHDIFFPFEYPQAWLEEGRFWNEAYFLRSLLQDSPRYRIRWFNDYLRRVHGAEVAQLLPTWSMNPGGSIYLEIV